MQALRFGKWLFAALALVTLAAMAMDGRQLQGVSVWLKPLKFNLSITIFLATVEWFLSHYLAPQAGIAVARLPKILDRSALLITIAMLVEIALISTQALRGVRSHFNNDTPFDAILFGVMGLFIVLNTAALATLAYHFWRRPPALSDTLSPAMLQAIRYSLLIAIFASLQGFMMTSRQSHSVGGPDGGPGLPFLNWSVQYGDLRVAHGFGLHAMQALPLLALLLQKTLFSANPMNQKSNAKAATCVTVAAGLYMLGFLWLTWQALHGVPVSAQ